LLTVLDHDEAIKIEAVVLEGNEATIFEGNEAVVFKVRTHCRLV